MANKKLSGLTEATSPAGGELIYLVQGGNSRKLTLGAVGAKLLDDTGFTGALTSIGVTALGRSLLDDTGQTTMQTTLGFTSLMRDLINDTGQTTAQTTLGGGAGGRQLFAAASLVAAADLLPVMETGSDTGSVDFDTLTDPGYYGQIASTNAPNTTYTGEWLVTVASSDATSNVYQIAAPAINPQAQWARRRISAVWSAWKPVGGAVTPEHYGATGAFDAGADDATYLETALRSGFKTRLVGDYNLGTLIQCGSGFGDTGVFLEGCGKEHIRVTAATAGIKFKSGTPTTQTALRGVFKDFNMVCAVASHTGTALYIAGDSGAGSGATVKTFEVSNIQMFASADTNGFSKGVSVFNGRNGTIRGCSYQGIRSQTAGARAGIGFELKGDHDPVDMLIDDCEAYYGQYGFSVTGTCEGTRITNSTAVACDRGGYVELDENPISGINAGKQLVQIDNCHFNCFAHGLYISRVWDVYIQNTSILYEAANSNCQGIYLNTEGQIQARAHIDSCAIMDRTAGAPGSGSTQGINIESDTGTGSMTRITNTVFDSVDTALFGQTGTLDVRYDSNSCIFTNCGATIGGDTGAFSAY